MLMKLLLICLLIVLGSYAHAQDSEDLQIKLITGSNRAVYDKCASLNPEKYQDKPFDNDNPVVCIAYTRDPPSCTIYSPEPVSDEEWQVERHLCIEIARHVMLEQERGT